MVGRLYFGALAFRDAEFHHPGVNHRSVRAHNGIPMGHGFHPGLSLRVRQGRGVACVHPCQQAPRFLVVDDNGRARCVCALGSELALLSGSQGITQIGNPPISICDPLVLPLEQP